MTFRRVTAVLAMSAAAVLTLAPIAAATPAGLYTPTDTSGYDARRDLSVVVGTRTGSVDGHPQRAQFFHLGRPAGAAPEGATVRWLWSTGDTVAIGYDLYRPSDPMCCPSAGAATVRYKWDGSRAVALDPVPPSSFDAPVSRR